MEITTHSTSETEELAKQIASKLKPKDVLALYGDLGSGKTTFTSHLVKALGSESRVQSPTFVIIRNYEVSKSLIKTINHVDLYRLTSFDEAEDLGLFEMLNDAASISIIEWPELIEEKLPSNAKRIYFKYVSENERQIDAQDFS